MNLYDGIIARIGELLSPYPFKVWSVDERARWAESGRNEILFAADTAFEAGGGGNPSVGFTAVTSTDMLFDGGNIYLYGRDLNELNSETPFAAVILAEADSFSDDAVKCYNAVKDIDFIIYDVFLKDCMTRISALDRKIQIRVGKRAKADGISFEAIGNTIAAKYLAHPSVKNVSIIFITENIPVFRELSALAKKTDEITLTLNKVLSDMNFDCATCNLKSICDEVEGLRELHFKNKK